MVPTSKCSAGELEANNKRNHSKREVLIIVLFNVVFGLLLGTCIVIALTLNSDITSIKTTSALKYQHLEQQLNLSILKNEYLEQQLNLSIDSVFDRTLRLNTSTNLILDALEGQYQFNPAASCASLPPISLSGNYWVRASNGSAVRVYCDMTRSCGGVTGGWMRVAELDMTDSSHQCPSGFVERNKSNIRVCARIGVGGGCSSVNFAVSGVQYSSVCGRVIGYQASTTDAFDGNPSIEVKYVDGVSLTHGDPRQHIWTFVAALDEVSSFPGSNCPCINTNTSDQASSPPAFVGDDYFCDTASEEHFQRIFYGDDPLWDGAGCGPLNTCCSFNNPPWFYKQLPQPTTDDIELRLCTSINTAFNIFNEDIFIEIIDIYVQ